MTEERKNRIKGSIWGLIVGDALGSPLQFGPARKEGNFLTEMEYCKVFGVPAGCWTDDGSQALCIIDSYIRNTTLDFDDIMKTLCRWEQEGYLSSMPYSFDEGGTTATSLYNYRKNGTLVNGAGRCSNGSLMRFAPAYFIAKIKYHTNANRMIMNVNNLTHASDVVQNTINNFISVMDDVMRGVKPKFKGHYVEENGGVLKLAPRDKVGTNEYAPNTLAAALWAFYKSGSFEDSLVEMVNLGGDSDTTGAVCGQILGAYYGYDAIPRRWVEVVKDWRKIDNIIDSFIFTLS